MLLGRGQAPRGDRPSSAGRVILRTCGRIAGELVFLFAVYALIPLDTSRWWIGALIGAVSVVLTVPILIRRVHMVMRSDWPVPAAVEAIVVVAAVLMISFSAVYVALSHHGEHFTDLETRVDAIYFSMATFSTVGFGDIATVSQTSRVIVTVQMVANIALIGVGIRVLIAAARRRTSEQRAGGGPFDEWHEHL